jgi:hypothetical protein
VARLLKIFNSVLAQFMAIICWVRQKSVDFLWLAIFGADTPKMAYPTYNFLVLLYLLDHLRYKNCQAEASIIPVHWIRPAQNGQ